MAFDIAVTFKLVIKLMVKSMALESAAPIPPG